MSYKDEQELARMKMRPRVVPEEEWDSHDRLFMEASSTYNRKTARRKFRDAKHTNKRFKGSQRKRAK